MPRRRKSEAFSEEEAAVQAARASEGVERDTEILELREILADEKVRRFLWRVLEHSRMFAESFHPNFGLTGHNLGRAAMGKWILNEITEADHTAWLLMQQDHYLKQVTQAQEREAAEPPADA